MKKLVLFPLVLLAISLFSQINFTAKEFVPPAYHEFGYGVNMGSYKGWTDEELANIAAGNPDAQVTGLGANSVRIWLPDWFTQEWGYDIRVEAFKHYENLGMQHNVVFVGDPSPAHSDPTMYCPSRKSESFANLYEPIWDNGANGTPVNEENYFAIYLYNLVQKYGAQTKYWEVINEPDNDLGGNAAWGDDHPNNWWTNNPPPCETKYGAPIQHYVRMLRIAYEVIKSLSPEDYIAVGGLGNASFLDAIMRNSDNPVDGSITGEFPNLGGAYFDCLSFHAYPHFDGTMRYWSDIFGGFQWERNSDGGTKGFFSRMDSMIELMKNYGYGKDLDYPEKVLICTETNFTRKSLVDQFLGTEEAQRNYVIKLLVEGQKRGIKQIHFYSLADNLPANQANSDFDFMGLFENLENVPFRSENMLDAGIAFKSASTQLKGYEYDHDLTQQLNLTQAVRGAAFVNAAGEQVFVLWAATLTDETEAASINYAFPPSFTFAEVKTLAWDFSATGAISCESARNVSLSGSPVFLIPDSSSEFNCETGFSIKVMPNPFSKNFNVEIQTDIDEVITIDLIDTKGALIQNLTTDFPFYIGKTNLPFRVDNLKPGVYYLSVNGISTNRVFKMMNF